MKKLEIPRRFPGYGKRSRLFAPPRPERFRLKTRIRRQLANRKRRIERRLDRPAGGGDAGPVMTARTVNYEIGDRARGICHGGIGTGVCAAPEPNVFGRALTVRRQ
jgi:hypothetical protein